MKTFFLLIVAFITSSVLCSGSAFAADNYADTAIETRNAKDASVRSVSRDRIISFSSRIDELVSSQLGAKSEKRNKRSSDEVFVRRAHLDIIGRIPTMEETVEFLESKEDDKRAVLIDNLIDSYGHVSHQFNFLADLLRIKSRSQNMSGQPYIDFIKDSLQENKPYDQLVRELLQSSGPLYEKGNGAVGYYLRDVGMPEDNMSNTVRIFLGTRLECAQCHDHPFDKWTQRQYFEMVAFTGGMKFRDRKAQTEYAKDLARMRRNGDLDPSLQPFVRRLVQPATYKIEGTGTGLARLPEGFMGDDGEEFEIVKAKTLFEGEKIVDPSLPSSRRARKIGKNKQYIYGAKEIDSRKAFAHWMTDADNPRFAKVIANRLWKHAFGLGLIEPVDTIEDNTVASNPELMDFLTQTMIELEFDMKQFLRVIYNTKTYQANATGHDIANPREYNFNGPIVRRMSAEQIWDSLLTISIPETDQRATGSSSLRGYGNSMGEADSIYERYEELKNMSAEELVAMAEKIKNRRGGGQMSMENQSEIQKLKRQERNALAQKRKEFSKQMRKAKRSGDDDKVRELMIMRNEYMSEYQKNRRGSTLKRASELQSPAPAGHFLREFGQSDREEIENANYDPAVTQVLSMMNGFIETKVASNPNTVLMKNVFSAADGKKINAVYLTMLNRNATRGETKSWVAEAKQGDPKDMLSDLIWVLANSNEFIFIK